MTARWTGYLQGLLEAADEAMCERIVCLYGHGVEPAWWREFEGDEPLFAPPGRITEVPLEETAEAIRQAVAEGFLPVLFVPHPAHWPMAWDAAGRYQAITQVYVFGRDDTRMTDLLHHPGPEVEAVYAGGGTIVVPTLAYGKALDAFWFTDLRDFVLVESATPASPLTPLFRAVSRLNGYRELALELDCNSGGASLSQRYRFAKEGVSEPCGEPLWHGDRSLAFPGGICKLAPEDAGVVQALVEHLELPVAYRGWAAGERAPWALRQQLGAIAAGKRAYLSRAQQALLGALRASRDAATEILTLVGAAMLSTALPGTGGPTPALRVRGAVRTRGAAVSREAPLSVLVTGTEREADDLLVLLHWLDPPATASPPEALVFMEEQPIDTPRVEWGPDLSSLRVRAVPEDQLDVSWSWNGSDQTLRIYLRRPAG